MMESISNANNAPTSGPKASHIHMVPSGTLRHHVQPYRYRSIQHPKPHIRLVSFRHIEKGNATPPHCDMHVFDLATIPEYYALSYTWGPPTPTHAIVVNDGYLCIRESLFKFCEEASRDECLLRPAKPTRRSGSKRKGHGTVYFWIDQICINQADISERNHQVPLMSRIYSKASMTFIWLHDEGKPDPPPFVNDTPYASSKTQILPAAIRWRIACHTYFTRLWVVQEILLAKRIQIMLEGGSTASWIELEKAMDTGNMDFVDQSPEGFRGLSRIKNLVFDYDYIVGGNISPIFTWIVASYCRHDCSDPRDKVYGLMGLLKDHQIKVDYNKSIPQVLIDVLETTSRMNISRWSPNHEGGFTPLEKQEMVSDYVQDLAILGSELGLTHLQHNGWINFADAVLKENDTRLATLKYDPALDRRHHWREYDETVDWPMKSLGFESDSISRLTLVAGEKLNAEYWWYESNGQRHTFPCLSLSRLQQKPTSNHTRPDNPKLFHTENQAADSDSDSDFESGCESD